MNCDEYVTGFLSAHADGELTREEENNVEGHLGTGAEDGCAACRARLAEENLLKALIRRQAPTVSTPEELKARIRGALDRLDAEAPPQPAKNNNTLMRQLRRPRIWMPLAAVTAIIVALFIGSLPGVRNSAKPDLGGVSAMAPSVAFGQAADALRQFERPGGFDANVPSGSIAQIASAYGAVSLPNEMWNFERSGYSVFGGRLSHLSDGTPVTYTLYHGTNGDILNMRYRANDFSVPPGAATSRNGHRFYRYKGYSLCLTISEHAGYVDILAARMPLAKLEQAVSTAGSSHLGK